MDSQQYWNQKIVEWENSQHGDRNISLIEKLATHFRGPLIVRSRISMELLGPVVPGKRVLEIGCGSGFFAHELYDRFKPAEIHGVDFSESAIARAKSMAESKGLADVLTFEQGDACEAVRRDADITLGLGLLDYISSDELIRLFTSMRSPHFVFTFAERIPTLLRFAHVMYLKSQTCPKHFYYTEEEMRNFIGDRFGQVHFVRDPGLSFGCFVHNLPAR